MKKLLIMIMTVFFYSSVSYSGLHHFEVINDTPTGYIFGFHTQHAGLG